MRGADEHLVADLQRGELVLGAIAIALGDVTGVVGPRHLQLVDVVAVDLIQRSKAATALGITVVRPVLLRVGWLDGCQARPRARCSDSRVRNEHVASGHRQRNRQHSSDAIGTATWDATIGTLEQRVDQRDRQANGAEHEQAREHRPEHQPGITDRPDRRAHQKRSEQPGTGRFEASDQQTGNGHHQPTYQEVPGASQADQLHAPSSKRQAEQGDDHAQPDHNEF
ncbi:hypothetical protein D3C76_15450 [compost metagenome]